MSNEATSSAVSDISGIHAIHDYCSKLTSSPPQLKEEENDFMNEVVIPGLIAEEVFLESVIDVSHNPNKIIIKKEIIENDEVEMIGAEDVEMADADEQEDDDKDDIKPGNSGTPAPTYCTKNTSKLWTDSNIQLLLDCRLKYDELFRFSLPGGRSKPWAVVLKKMKETCPDFPASDIEISSKFRNLTSTYRHNRLLLSETKNPLPISWPWYKDMHRILAKKESKRPVKNYYSTMCRMAQQGRLGEALSRIKQPSSHLYYGWSISEMETLISACGENSTELRLCPRKVRIWKKIKNRITEQIPSFRKPYTKVYSHWKRLVTDYRKAKRERKRQFEDDPNAIPSRVPPWYYAMDTLVSSWQHLDEWDLGDDSQEEDSGQPEDDFVWEEAGILGTPKLKAQTQVSWDKKDVIQDYKADIWTKRDIELLIKHRTENEELFQDPERSYLDNWSQVRDLLRLDNPGPDLSYKECADKWCSLITKYHVVTKKRKTQETPWEWWDSVHDALFKQTTIIREKNEAIISNEFDKSSKYSSNPVIVIQEMEDGQVTTSTSKQGTIWTNKNVDLLIKARSLVPVSQLKKRTRWSIIRRKMIMLDAEFNGSSSQCWAKWRNLVHTYTLNKKRCEKLGRASVTWEWYDAMDNLEEHMHEALYTTDNEAGEGMSMLESEEDEQADKEKLWTNKNIRLLLNVREEFKGLFTRPRSALKSWEAVRDRMVALDPTFQGSAVGCTDKFRNLLGTYRSNKRRLQLYGRDNVYVNWVWYNDIDRIMNDTRPDLTQLASISDIEEDSTQPLTDNEGGYGGFQSEYDDAETDAKTGKSEIWTTRNIRFLIESRGECKPYFSNGSKKGLGWDKVRERICEKNPSFNASTATCSRKWRNLSFTYRAAKWRQKLGEEPQWPWFKMMDSFYTSISQENDVDENAPIDEPIERIGEPESISSTNKLVNEGSGEWRERIMACLYRMEQRELRAEEREERMLAIMEQLLVLERLKQQNASSAASYNNYTIEDRTLHHELNSSQSETRIPIEQLSPPRNDLLGPKARLSQLLDTRATILEEVRNYSDLEFKNRFRISRDIFKSIKNRIVYMEMSGGRPRLSKDLSMYICFWLLGNGNENYRSTADRFGIHESSCYRIHKIIVKKIANLHEQFIKWPKGNEMKGIQNGFNSLRGQKSFPGVIGCLDGTHIAIRKQTTDSSYMNSNNHHSVILQAVCDHRGVFLDVCAGWPGSLHDSTVWRASPLYQVLESEENTIPNDCHILADCAYPLSLYLMKPYPVNGNLSTKQAHFNNVHNATWEVIEGAFALLKARWTCLKKTIDSLDLDFIKDIIMACCVLHNMCILKDDDSKYEITMDTTVELDSGANHYDSGEEPDIAAELKRSAVTELLWRNDKKSL